MCPLQTAICFTEVFFIDSDLFYRDVLYRQRFVLQRCPLQTVICYIEVCFIDSDLLYRGVLYRQQFALQRCPLQTVICYIEVPFKAVTRNYVNGPTIQFMKFHGLFIKDIYLNSCFRVSKQKIERQRNRAVGKKIIWFQCVNYQRSLTLLIQSQ